jgi:hypothetical protein
MSVRRRRATGEEITMRPRDRILLALLLLVSSHLHAQVQVGPPPRPGYEQRIRDAIDQIRIVDTHEHLLAPSILTREQPLDFTLLLFNYPRVDFVAAGMPADLYDRLWSKSSMTATEKWRALEPYWAAASNTAYNRAGILAADRLFGIKAIDASSVEALSSRIRAAYADDPHKWFYEVLREKCRIEYVIEEDYRGDSGDDLDPAMFKFARSFDDFIWIRSSKDLEHLRKQWNTADVDSVAGLGSGLAEAFAAGLKRGMVGVKSTLAYFRPLHFENMTEEQAQAALRKVSGSSVPLSLTEVKPLQDYLMHRLLALLDTHRLPVQFHTGLQWDTGHQIETAKPTHLVNSLIQYPRVRFVLLHGSYPYGGELATLAKNYSNVYVEMSWTYVISPSYAERYLHEWLETVPASKIMAFGGDDLNVEAVYGHLLLAKQVIAKVLSAKVADGYLTEDEALKIARMILRDNALRVFNLSAG